MVDQDKAQKAQRHLFDVAGAMVKAQERFLLDLARAVAPAKVEAKSVRSLRIFLDEAVESWAREHVPQWDVRDYPQILGNQLKLEDDESAAKVPSLIKS